MSKQMTRRNFLHFTSGVAGAATLTTYTPRPTSNYLAASARCEVFVNDLVNYMQTHKPKSPGFNEVRATMSIHQTNDTVSFCPTSALRFLRGQNPVFSLNSFQYFGDRVRNGQPFDQAQKDSVRLNLYINPVRVELILESWGNGSMLFDPLDCAGNLLYSINPTSSVLAISFQKTERIQKID